VPRGTDSRPLSREIILRHGNATRSLIFSSVLTGNDDDDDDYYQIKLLLSSSRS
jgi:hypothetical protein